MILRVFDVEGERIIDNIDEVRIDYSRYLTSKEDPKCVRILRKGLTTPELIDVSQGAYLMNDEGQTIDKYCIKRSNKEITIHKKGDESVVAHLFEQEDGKYNGIVDDEYDCEIKP